MKHEESARLSAALEGAAHWRMRGNQMKAFARECSDPPARAMMLRIAADYDRLAKHAGEKNEIQVFMMIKMASDYVELTNRTQGFTSATHVILGPQTRKSVAVIRDRQVFRLDKERAKLAIIHGSYSYDLKGALVGRLGGGQVIEAGTQIPPKAFQKLLEGHT